LLPIPPLDGFHVFSELFPVLKPLGENQLGLMLMMILFLVPGVGRGLSAVASFVIQLLVG
jgi:membrane-associated protease RseP (regulator of RpoE activity)